MKKDAGAVVCERIRATAAERGYTQAKLARESGVSYRTINAIWDTATNPRDDVIQAIARTLKVSTASLGAEHVADMIAALPESGQQMRIAESPGPYEVAKPSGSMPLVDLMSALARHVGCSQDEVLEFVLLKLKDKRP